MWHHVAFSIGPSGTGSTVRWWVDGVLVASSPTSVPWTPAPAPLKIYANGTTIDELELFDGAL
jgi:hypothetical protein